MEVWLQVNPTVKIFYRHVVSRGVGRHYAQLKKRIDKLLKAVPTIVTNLQYPPKWVSLPFFSQRNNNFKK